MSESSSSTSSSTSSSDLSSASTSSGQPRVTVHLRKGREKAVRQRHPWLFSGAVYREEGDPAAAVARVVAANGRVLGAGFFSPGGRIRVRLATLGEAVLDEGFFRHRLEQAWALRRELLPADTTGYRLLNAEGDGLPGWTIDRYGDVLVSQVTSAGLESLRPAAHAALSNLLEDGRGSVAGWVQRNDLPARRQEGLSLEDEVVMGEVPEQAAFTECGLRFTADLAAGQKTGFYCDQRESRRRVEKLAAGRRVLDLFAHSGAFTCYALRGGAEKVTAVESAPRPLERAQQHLQANVEVLDPQRVDFHQADVFRYLRELPADPAAELIVCDPPPLAPRRGARDAGARAYKDLNRLALKALAPGGLLLTFTCSSAIDSRLFRQILFAAARDAETRVQLLQPLSAAVDHPVSIDHPEGEYLKGWLLRRVG
ncbi:MAG: class I SAM-dependent rRNA methyltransferase [Acidobacteriota bacterium]